MRQTRKHRTLRFHAELCVRSLRVGLLARGFRGSSNRHRHLPTFPKLKGTRVALTKGGFPHTVAGPRRLLTGFPFMPRWAPKAIKNTVQSNTPVPTVCQGSVSFNSLLLIGRTERNCVQFHRIDLGLITSRRIVAASNTVDQDSAKISSRFIFLAG